MKKRMLITALALALLAAVLPMTASAATLLGGYNGEQWAAYAGERDSDKLIFQNAGEVQEVTSDAFTLSITEGMGEVYFTETGYVCWDARSAKPDLEGTLTATRIADGFTGTMPVKTLMPYNGLFRTAECTSDGFVTVLSGYPLVDYGADESLRTVYYVLPDFIDSVFGEIKEVVYEWIDAEIVSSKVMRITLKDGYDGARAAWIKYTTATSSGEPSDTSTYFTFTDGRSLFTTNFEPSFGADYGLADGYNLVLMTADGVKLTNGEWDLTMEGEGAVHWYGDEPYEEPFDGSESYMVWTLGGLPGTVSHIVATPKAGGESLRFRVEVLLPVTAWYSENRRAPDAFLALDIFDMPMLPYGENRTFWLISTKYEDIELLGVTLEQSDCMKAEIVGKAVRVTLDPEVTGAHFAEIRVKLRQQYEGSDEVSEWEETSYLKLNDGKSLYILSYDGEKLYFKNETAGTSDWYRGIMTPAGEEITPETFDVSMDMGGAYWQTNGQLMVSFRTAKAGHAATLTATDKKTGSAYTFRFPLVMSSFSWLSQPECKNEYYLASGDEYNGSAVLPCDVRTAYLMPSENVLDRFPEQTFEPQGSEHIKFERVDDKTIKVTLDPEVPAGVYGAKVRITRAYEPEYENTYDYTVIFADADPLLQGTTVGVACIVPKVGDAVVLETENGVEVTPDDFDITVDGGCTWEYVDEEWDHGIAVTTPAGVQLGDMFVLRAVRKSDGKPFFACLSVILPTHGIYSENVTDVEHFLGYPYGTIIDYLSDPALRTVWMRPNDSEQLVYTAVEKTAGSGAVSFELVDGGVRIELDPAASGAHQAQFSVTMTYDEYGHEYTDQFGVNFGAEQDAQVIDARYSESDADLTVQVNFKAKKPTTIICALYDGDGRMSGLQTRFAAADGYTAFVFAAALPHGSVRIFLVGTDGSAPLSADYEVMPFDY